MTPMPYRRKPIRVEAMLFDGSPECAAAIIGWAACHGVTVEIVAGLGNQGHRHYALRIGTIEGLTYATPGDHIVRDDRQKFYSVESDDFQASYEPVLEEK